MHDTAKLKEALTVHKIDAVIHFAGLKAVGESVEKPIEYYDNNVSGTISLLKAIHVVHIKTFVFSSSATVYSDSQYLPLDEGKPVPTHNVAAANCTSNRSWQMSQDQMRIGVLPVCAISIPSVHTTVV